MDRFLNHLNEAIWDEIGKKLAGPGRARAKILFFVRVELGPGSDLNFNFSFGPVRARAEIFLLYFEPGRAKIVAMRAGPGLDWKIRPLQTSNIVNPDSKPSSSDSNSYSSYFTSHIYVSATVWWVQVSLINSVLKHIFGL